MEPANDMLGKIVAWAQSEPAIQAVILTGSHARDDGSADGLSDFDVEVFADGHERYAASDAWMSAMGEVWLYLPLPSGRDGLPNRLVIYDGGAKVDFSLKPLTALQDLAASTRLPELYRRGYRVLLDKTGLAAGLPPPAYRPSPSRTPSQSEFTALVEEFLFEAYHVAKYLKRDNLWTAKLRDSATKELLLRMIELHEKALHGAGFDTRHLGHRMRDWVEPDLWQEVRRSFARFDAEDSWNALEATMQLFSRIACQASERLGLSYPEELNQKFAAYIRSLRSAA